MNSNISIWVEIFDPLTELVWREFDTLKEAMSEVKIWNLDKLGYKLRWVAAERVGDEYRTFAYASTEKEIKQKAKEWNTSKV